MTAITMRTGGEFRIGNVITRAWSVLFANFTLFFTVAFVVALPNTVYLLQQAQETQPQAPGAGFAIGTILALLLGTLGQAIILFGAFQYLRGQPVQFGEAFQRGLSRFFPLIGVAILYMLGVFFASILLVVPGLILMVMWTISVPACVVEGLGPTKSLGRSARLTKGHRWKIFGLVILLIIINLIASALIGLVLQPAGAYAAVVGNLIWMAVWGAFWHCVIVMTYHDLRVAKEGIDTEQIASVFD
jgi:uncharacterized membrane protein